MHKVLLEDNLFIESLDDYVKVHLTDRTIISRENISSLEAKLPMPQFGKNTSLFYCFCREGDIPFRVLKQVRSSCPLAGRINKMP